MSATKNIGAADLVQEEKHNLQGRALLAEEQSDDDTASAYRYAAQALQRVEDKLRAAAEPAVPMKVPSTESIPVFLPTHEGGTKPVGYVTVTRRYDDAAAESKDALHIDLGHVPKMNADEAQCIKCGCVVSKDYIVKGTCMNCGLDR